MKKHQRFRLFVDKAVQGALARRFLMHWVALAVCMFVVTAGIHVLADPLTPPQQQWRSYVAKNGQTFFVLALLTPAFLWDSIKLSHRFCGPVSRLRKQLQSLSAGESAQDLRFRGGDFWQDLADNFNGIRDELLEARKQLGSQPDTEQLGEEADQDNELTSVS